jgi:hypothetical protein
MAAFDLKRFDLSSCSEFTLPALRFEAATRSTPELRALYREALNSFTAAPCGSLKRDTALASMQNINAELAVRPPGL